MPATMESLKFTRKVRAPAADVFRAFTSSGALREWLCDVADADAHQGGRLYMWWNGGYYTCGEFTQVLPDRRLAFTWRGRNEPGDTLVRVALKQQDDLTTVTLVHSGLGRGKKWAPVQAEYMEGWSAGLENLQSVLETGDDLRITRRPLLGIAMSPLDIPTATQLGVPVAAGAHLDAVVEGLGAHAAGLRADDVIVTLDGKKVRSFATLTGALRHRRAGDKVRVGFYRGAEHKMVTMELSPRPHLHVPPAAAELAETLRRQYLELDAELKQSLAGLLEDAAGERPTADGWSVKETLAHLIAVERDTQAWIAELLLDAEPLDPFPGNARQRLEATVSVYPALPDLLAELHRAEDETVALLAALPPEFVARKGSYVRLGNFLLEMPEHTRLHIQALKAER